MNQNVVFGHPVIVEFEDVDSYRIAHHSRLIAYLERARVHYFDAQGVGLKEQRYGMVVYRMDCRFIRPARLLDRLTTEVIAVKTAEYHLVMSQRISRGRDVIAKATVTHAFVSLETGETIPIPDSVLRAVSADGVGEETLCHSHAASISRELNG